MSKRKHTYEWRYLDFARPTKIIRSSGKGRKKRIKVIFRYSRDWFKVPIYEVM